jgi:hypothetical protein
MCVTVTRIREVGKKYVDPGFAAKNKTNSKKKLVRTRCIPSVLRMLERMSKEAGQRE